MNLTAKDPLAKFVVVRLNGADVTRDCRAANVEDGYVVLIDRDVSARAHKLIETRRYGRVTLELKLTASDRMRALFNQWLGQKD